MADLTQTFTLAGPSFTLGGLTSFIRNLEKAGAAPSLRIIVDHEVGDRPGAGSTYRLQASVKDTGLPEGGNYA